MIEANSERGSWERLEQLLESGDVAGLKDYVEAVGPFEVFRGLLRLSPEVREKVLTTLSPDDAADLIEELPDEHAADLIEQLPAADAASILHEMDSDDQADVIGELAEDDAEAILSLMEPAEAADVRELVRYDPETAGGLMAKELFAFSETTLVRDVLEELDERAEEGAPPEVYLYVVSPLRRLVGVVDFRDVVLSRRSTVLGEIAKSPIFVSTDLLLDDLEDFFDRHGFSAVPVVDERQQLIGVVRKHDVREALIERAEHDFMKTQGIVGGDEIRTMPVLVRSKRRLSWLSINVVLNIIAASVIALFEDTLQAVIALAVFLPIVSDMSGCTGNQAVAVSMRELSLGIVKPTEVFRVWLQEIKVGVLNGMVLGMLVGTAALLWKGNPYLGLVVGGALAANTLIAVSIGGTVPLLLKRIRVDPAVASGPILTTVTDMCGFFLVLGLATIMLPLLATPGS